MFKSLASLSCDLFQKLARTQQVQLHRICNLCCNERSSNYTTIRTFHQSTWRLCKVRVTDRKKMLASVPRRDEGVSGENSVDLDISRMSKDAMFPDENTADMLFDGIRFADLPIINIHVSKNNTLMALTDSKGVAMTSRSCGTEGFKNTKKGTNVAAQATGIALARRALREYHIKTVRVMVKGLGPGRMASVKGLQMAGINIISISDMTPYMRRGPRPRKQRRL